MNLLKHVADRRASGQALGHWRHAPNAARRLDCAWQHESQLRQFSDGAGACLVVDESHAERQSLRPLRRFLGALIQGRGRARQVWMTIGFGGMGAAGVFKVP